MYIDPFVAGIVSTIVVEMIIFVSGLIFLAYKQNGGKK